ncbi:very short patch repair endonuclease [Rhodobacteraceae bacterium D3-12]|nr:very short patch repair endonuclease [Rhodobacteraceae bacterium D3-12]
MATKTDTKRSQIKRAVKCKDTTPEMVVRRLVHSLGYRYRLHRSDLPGQPDLVFGPHRKLIFVHGCFWHGHTCKRGNHQPKTNADYWRKNIQVNKERDKSTLEELHVGGWETLVIWECETRQETPKQRIDTFLRSIKQMANLSFPPVSSKYYADIAKQFL